MSTEAKGFLGIITFAVAIALAISFGGTPGDEPNPNGSYMRVGTAEEVQVLDSETDDLDREERFDQDVEELFDVLNGTPMREAAKQICLEISYMEPDEFSIYAMSFIRSAAGGEMGKSEEDWAHFLGLSIGAYCPQSADLIY